MSKGGPRAGSGRPKKDEADKVKYLTASISLIPKDMEQLKQKAKDEGCSVSQLVKRYILISKE